MPELRSHGRAIGLAEERPSSTDSPRPAGSVAETALRGRRTAECVMAAISRDAVCLGIVSTNVVSVLNRHDRMADGRTAQDEDACRKLGRRPDGGQGQREWLTLRIVDEPPNVGER